ncbi:SecDF P1 head subdomain-containing protein [Kribbella albertanoniae]|uniref:SecDF P1 head subdomain domain-containing protein n=1 Tax=Kribbella albertanoniae TaxID=1266829 RepID=A0A4R4Q1N0_9ACTN|nr:hypothetical protein [Kribbella albertanoniae]TDC28848.1 hypothetical protein E1261_17380 [Kribbella albertanoniae]
MAQSYPPPQPGAPVKRSRGPVVLVLLLVVVLIATLAGIVVIVLKRVNEEQEPAPPKPAAADTLQFRRVVKLEPNACAKGPLAANVRCSDDGTRYTLGQVELDGSHVTKVEAAPNTQGTGWLITLTLDTQGTKVFAALTTDLVTKQPPRNQLAIVVKDKVVSAPTVSGAITAGQVQIAGNFTSKEAKKLASDITG